MVVVMYKPDDLRVVGVCDGADGRGRCPRVLPGDEVPCVGLDLVVAKGDGKSAEGLLRPRVRALAGATICPVASIHLERCYFSPFATVA